MSPCGTTLLDFDCGCRSTMAAVVPCGGMFRLALVVSHRGLIESEHEIMPCREAALVPFRERCMALDGVGQYISILTPVCFFASSSSHQMRRQQEIPHALLDGVFEATVPADQFAFHHAGFE